MKPKLLTTLTDYTPRLFLGDALAGITVALVALPLSIAIAIASGAPPSTGPITAIIAGFLISALGGSRVQIGGPTGAFIVVVYDVIHQHGYEGLLTSTMMAGAILLAAALLATERRVEREPSAALTGLSVEGLLGQHPRVQAFRTWIKQEVAALDWRSIRAAGG